MNWRIERDWPGETVFILASGPSLLSLDLSRLVGRRVIAVKSSWLHWPAADMLFFADGRWWREPRLRPPADFAGEIVTTAQEIGDPRVMRLTKVEPTALATDPGKLALARTSTTGAINIAAHKGAARVVLLGVDARRGPDGARHSHRLPWPWNPGGEQPAFDAQIAEYRRIAPSAEAMGLAIFNANPASAVDAFPKISFDEALRL